MRLSTDPGGDATVVVLDPSDSGSGFNRYQADYWGRVTNQPAGETSAVTDRWNSGTLLRFDSSNWEDPQTVRLNIHCADHDPHTWNEIWHKVTYPGDRYNIIEPVPGSTTTPPEMRARSVDNSLWQVTRIRVNDTGALPDPDDLAVASAYAGTLTASLSGSVSKRCESSEPGGACEWGLGVQWDWTTVAHPNDIFDAERRFWGFRFKVESGEGSDEWTYSYVPQPTYTRMVKPDAVVGWSMHRNTSSYHGGVEPSGLYTTVGSAENPGNPVYRITVTPVTLRGQEATGEADTICVQMQSRLVSVPQNKHAVVVNCDTMFTALDAIPGQFSPSSFMRTLVAGPSLTITSDARSVSEGERITFTITAASPVVVDTIVQLSLSEELGDEGDRIGSHQLGTVTIAAGERSATWTVTTLADEVERGDGFAIAEIWHGDGYTLGEPSSVSVALTDDDAPATPELSISGGSGITEGDTVNFTITASPAPASPITVNVGVSERGAFGASGAATVEVSGAATTYTAATVDDEVDEADGSVTATLLDGSGYTVSASQGAATVSVADDDAAGYTVDPQVVANVKLWMAETYHGAAHVNRWQRVLVAFGELDADGVSGGAMSAAEAQGYADRGWQRWVSVVAELTALEASQQDPTPTSEVRISAGGGITEGGDASFTLTANPAPAADLDVSVTVSASGDYGAATGKRTVTIPTTGSATLTVGTTNDDADEADGSVTATLDTPAADAGYTVSASRGAATVSVADNDVPEVSITVGSGVTEGGDASFTLTANPAQAADLDVSVTVSASGDYGAATGQRTVTIPAAGSVTLTVPTTNNDADEPDGSVTATLDTSAADAGYTVSSSRGAATVSVADDDDPPVEPVIEPKDELTVTVEDASATEGDVLVFRILLSHALTEEFEVRWYAGPAYHVPDDRAHSRDYQAMSGVTVFAPGVTALTGEVWLEDDSENEPDEYFAVKTFLPGEWFTPTAVGTMTIVTTTSQIALDW